MRSILLAALFSFLAGPFANGAITLSDLNETTVQAALNAAAPGETIILPSGSASWTKTLSITKPVTLLGQTSVDYASETANDRTIILDDVSPRGPVIKIDVTSGNMLVEPTAALVTVKGLTLRGSAATTSGSNIAAVQLLGRCPAARISSIHFDSLNQSSLYNFGWVYGVMDNCLHDMKDFGLVATMGMAAFNDKANGDGSWAEDAHWGSFKFFFTENNVVHNNDPTNKAGNNIDAKRGARFVVRYSKIYNCSFLKNHGTEGGRDRGSRATEFYNNICKRTSTGGPGNPGMMRSGNILFHDNQYTGVALSTPSVGLSAFRTFVAFQPWGLADGRNGFDENDPHGLYATGGALTASTLVGGNTQFYVAGNLSEYDSGGYSVRNMRTGLGSLIMSADYNSSTDRTLITCEYATDWDVAKVVFLTGDIYEINRVLRVLDQTGLGAGDVMTGANPTPHTLNNAALEPSYAWNNTQANGPSVTIKSGGTPNPTFVEGRDYFNSRPPFAYTPYTYPHPLTVGATATPTPTATPTSTPSPSATPTPTVEPSPTPTPEPSPTPTPDPSPILITPTPSATPEGIAARYPGDKNIGSDPDVILADDFEAYTTAEDLRAKWNTIQWIKFIQIGTTEHFAGNKSLQFNLPISTAEQSAFVGSSLNNLETEYLRVYMKWDLGYSVNTSNHNGISMRGGVNPKTGQAPTGYDFFTLYVQNNNLRGEPPPGWLHAYTYTPEYQQQWGDHWYPDGYHFPVATHPNFVKMPNFNPERGKWYCYEMMTRLNTVGKKDGEVKVWVDGKVAADFTDLLIRKVDTLRINETYVGLHAIHNTERVNHKWYDNIVVAKKYIGPIASPTPTPTPTPAINKAPVAKAGADQTVRMPNSITIVGSCSDDGLPVPPGKCNFQWSKVSGPGSVTFSAPASLTTQAKFSISGTYVLVLTVNDGKLSGSDKMTVTVQKR